MMFPCCSFRRELERVTALSPDESSRGVLTDIKKHNTVHSEAYGASETDKRQQKVISRVKNTTEYINNIIRSLTKKMVFFLLPHQNFI